ncbi:MAG TPA: lysylphosphatidylglycerol synthase transmembrane domain-containing protein [Aggregatilineales bacterium]|nr:flippase-like domain-containing protein [Anaerolineales bacterium]HRE46318.1 lysylphosphatidylglycerol synthase transmembrane domain-containing protein [Aggregatilineales bacterium]
MGTTGTMGMLWGKYRRPLLIGVGLGAAAFVAVLLLSDVSQLVRYATAFPWLIMIPVLALRVGNWALRFLKWHFYLGLVGVPNIRVGDSAAVFLMGFPLAISPGKAAEVLKSFVLHSLTGTPIAQTLPVVAAERLSDGMAVLILIAWSLLSLADSAYWSVVFIPLALMVIGISILQIRPLCRWILHRLTAAPLIGRFAHSFEVFYESSYQIVRLRSLVVAVGLGTLANLLDGVGVYLILVGIGQPPTATTFFQALLVISLSVVAGSLSGMPGAIGASDLTITGSLQRLIGLGVAQAGFATLVIRVVQLWFGVFVGAAVTYLARGRLFTAKATGQEQGAITPPAPRRSAPLEGQTQP